MNKGLDGQTCRYIKMSSIGEMLNTKSNLNMQKIKKGIDQKVNVNWLKYILILALACYKAFLNFTYSHHISLYFGQLAVTVNPIYTPVLGKTSGPSFSTYTDKLTRVRAGLMAVSSYCSRTGQLFFFQADTEFEFLRQEKGL